MRRRLNRAGCCDAASAAATLPLACLTWSPQPHKGVDLSDGALQVGYIDDQNGPLCLAVVVVLALSGIFIVSAVDFVQQLRSHT